MKKQIICLFILLFLLSMLAAGCGKTKSAQTEQGSEALQSDQRSEDQKAEDRDIINPSSEIVSLEDGFSAVKYSGDYKLDEFLEHCVSSGRWRGAVLPPGEL